MQYAYAAGTQRNAQCGEGPIKRYRKHNMPKLKRRLLHPHDRLHQPSLTLHAPVKNPRSIHNQQLLQHPLRHRLCGPVGDPVGGFYEFRRLHVRGLHRGLRELQPAGPDPASELDLLRRELRQLRGRKPGAKLFLERGAESGPDVETGEKQ